MKGKYKYDTIKIDGLDYISGSRLIGEGKPDPDLHEYPEAFAEDLLDENGKLQWVIDRADPNRIYQAPQTLTSEEENEKTAEEKRKKIHDLFSPDDELNLLNSAIAALSEGKLLPEEYVAYRKAVDEILSKKLGKREVKSDG